MGNLKPHMKCSFFVVEPQYLTLEAALVVADSYLQVLAMSSTISFSLGNAFHSLTIDYIYLAPPPPTSQNINICFSSKTAEYNF